MNTFLIALLAALLGAGSGVALERWIQSLPEEEYPRERPIPSRGVTVPLVLALLLGGIGWGFAGTPLLVLLLSLYTLVLGAIFVTDFETRWIFSGMSYGGIALALLASPFDPRFGWRLALFGGAVALIFFGIAWLVGRGLFGRGAFGRGDVTLGTFIGLTTGFPAVIIAIILGVLANGIFALLLTFLGRRRGRVYIPYGPMLCVGGWIAMIWGRSIFRWWMGIP